MTAPWMVYTLFAGGLLTLVIGLGFVVLGRRHNRRRAAAEADVTGLLDSLGFDEDEDGDR